MKKIRKQTITSKTKYFIPLLLLSLTLLFCLTTVSAASGDAIYVNGSGGNDSWNGLSATWTSGTNGPKFSIKNATGTVNSGGTVYIANGTYNENNINITKNMNIIGESQKNTIVNGGNAGTIFYIQPGVNVQIKNLTLTNGKTSSIGGAYSNQTRLNGQDVYNGGAINNQGTLTVTNCNFTNNYATNNGAGGAIYNYGTLTVTGSTFTGNAATMGGAIYNLGTGTINNSTFTGNSANSGGAILDSAGTVNVHFSRIVANSAPSSGSNIYSPGGTTYAGNNWWGSNSGPSGIGGTVSANNWVILTVNAGPTTVNSGGTSTITTDLNHVNGGGALTGGSIPDGIPVTFSSTLGSINPVNAVTSNGQATATFTSTAYSGIAACSATVDGLKVSAPITITNAEIYVSTIGSDTTGDGSAGNPYQTVSKGVTCASPGGKVHIADGTYSGVNNTGIIISKSMNIIGQSQTGTIINGTNTAQIFTISSGLAVTIQNLTLVNGNSTTYGGAIFNLGTLTITGCTFTGNTAADGGAIYNVGTLNVNNCTFIGNTATDGGAIYNNKGTLTVNGCTFTGNTAQYSGAIENCGYDGLTSDRYGILTVYGSTFTGNTANQYGGAIINYISTLIVTSSTFTGNTANRGGVIYNEDGSVNVHFSQISNNTALVGNHMYNVYGGTLNATLNWWGTNTPNTSGNDIYNFGGTCTYDPWLILKVSANPTYLLNGGSSTLTANLLYDSQGNYHNPVDGCVPDGVPVTFAGTLGNINPTVSTMLNGEAQSLFTANSAGTANIIATVNGYQVSTQIISQATTNINVTSVHNFAGQNVNLAAHVKDYYNNPVNGGQAVFTVNHAGTLVSAGTASVINGVVTLTWTIPSDWNIGSYTVTAAFDGTVTNYVNSTCTGNLTVDQTPTGIIVDSVRNFAGQTVNLAAHVKDYYNNPVNGGKVSFTVNGVDVGTVNVNGGLASLIWTIPSNWNIGSYIIAADFNGTGTNYVNVTNSSTLTVDPTPTNVIVTSVHNFTGQNVTLTANVKDYYNNPVNIGQVTFSVNGVGVGTVNVNGGLATLIWQIPHWNAGNYIITAAFNGIGTNFANSIDTGNLSVDPTPTNLIVDNAGDFWHQYVDIAATLTDYYGNPLNGKTVSFTVAGDPNIYTAVTGINGLAMLHYQIVQSVGNYPITIAFDGTGTNYTNSSGTGTLTVDQTPTNVVVDSVHNFAGQTVTLTANVKDYYNHLISGGKVTFIVNGVNAGTANLNGGVATLTWTIPSNWKVGPYDITAIFDGTGTNYDNSTNSSILTVYPTPTNLTVGNVTGVNSKTVNLNATLTDVYGNPLTGKIINFKINGISIGTATTNNGMATLNYRLNSAGNFTVTAEFAGDGEYVNSTGNGTLTVNPSSDLYIQITSNKANPNVGETFTLTYKLGNKGPDPAQNVTITILLPEGFEIANISGDGNWTYNANNNTITWTLTNVPVGDPYLYISGKVLSPGSYVFSSSISSETYNINNQGVTPVTINAVPQVKAASSTTKTVGMLPTGLPLAGLVLAILAVFGGLVMPKRKN